MNDNEVFNFLSLIAYRDEVKNRVVSDSEKNQLINRLNKSIDYIGLEILKKVEEDMEIEQIMNKGE